jgi:hypothetical protein
VNVPAKPYLRAGLEADNLNLPPGTPGTRPRQTGMREEPPSRARGFREHTHFGVNGVNGMTVQRRQNFCRRAVRSPEW